jgi:hypothetical protein
MVFRIEDLGKESALETSAYVEPPYIKPIAIPL